MIRYVYKINVPQDSKSKLNLYLDQSTIDKLGKLAASNFRSLSQQVAALVEDANSTNLVKESPTHSAPVTAPAPDIAVSYRKTKKKKSSESK